MNQRLETDSRWSVAIFVLLAAPLTALSQQAPSADVSALEIFREELRSQLPALHPTLVIEDGVLVGFRVNTVSGFYLSLGLQVGDIVAIPGGGFPVRALDEQAVSESFESLLNPGSNWRVRSRDGGDREIVYEPQDDPCPTTSADILFC